MMHTMDCKQFREALDCYVHGELSADAAAAADAHRRECARCERVMGRILRLRREVKRVVNLDAPPPRLEQRVRTALRPRWMTGWDPAAPIGLRRTAAAALVVVGLATLWAAVSNQGPFARAAAGALDRVAIRLDESSMADIDGTVLCRDCELEHQYGIKASCKVIGHHGAIATADGRLWNIVEQSASADLIHETALLGKTVHVRARFFRRAGAIEVESYRVQRRAQDQAERSTAARQVVAQLEPVH
jgi:hypothetical protein